MSDVVLRECIAATRAEESDKTLGSSYDMRI